MAENLTIEKVTEAVANKMSEEKSTLVSKDEYQLVIDRAQKLEENLNAQTEKANQEIDALKSNILKLDTELKRKPKSTLKTEDINAHFIANEIVKQVFDENGEVKKGKVTIKAGDLCHTLDGYTNEEATVVDGVSASVLNLWTQIVNSVSTRRRSATEWYMNFPSITLTSMNLGKFAIKEDEALAVKIDECEVKPSTKIDLEFYSRRACKVAETFCFSDEYMMSSGNFFDQIVQVLTNRIIRSVPALFIQELIAQGSEFTNITGKTLPASANTYDYIKAVLVEMKCTSKCMVDQIHVSCEIMAELEDIKDEDGRYQFKCGCNDGNLFGNSIELIENDDLPDADGILFVDSSAVTKAEINGIQLEEITGEHSRQRNKRKWLAEVYFGVVVHPCDAECVKYDTLTDIKALLSA